MKVILALDIGSSSVRCTAFEYRGDDDKNNRLHHQLIPNVAASKSIRAVQPNTGRINLFDDNGTFLLDVVDICVDGTLKALREKEDENLEIVAVGISSFVMNLVAIDEQGKCLGPEASISYACNTPEVAKECRNLRETLGEERLGELYQATGAPIHSAYALAQLRAFYNNPSYTDIISRISQWTTIASIILSRWTGDATVPISFSEASWAGLLNIQNCEYESKILDMLPEACRKALPTLADFSDMNVKILEGNPYWQKWPELRSASLFLGVGDGACANIGSKCSSSSRIAVTVGTSAAARICLPHSAGSSTPIRVPRGLFCYRIDRSHILVGGALTDGGSVIEWVSQLLNLATEELFLECVEKVQKLVDVDCGRDNPSSDDIGPTNPLVMAPFLSGERSTGYRDGATGAILGLTRDTTPAHLFKSCLEGVTLRIAAILKLILQAQKESLGVPKDKDTPSVVASGKALEQNEMWRQMIADCSGLRVILDQDTYEGTSRGVVCLVAGALGSKRAGNSSTNIPQEEILNFKADDPRPKAQAYYNSLAEVQETFIDAVSPLYGE
jgi:gluconokinase